MRGGVTDGGYARATTEVTNAMGILRLLKLDFVPRNPDFALLVLRVWLGLSMLILHGWGKLAGFSTIAGGFPDPLGVGSTTSLALAVFSEVLCSALLVLGLFTRLSAAVLAITMGTAFFLVHQATLSGANSGELAFVYLAGYVVLLIAGGGRYALDAGSGSRA